MKTLVRLGAVLTACAWLAACSGDPKRDPAALQQQLRTLAEASYKGDFETVLRLTHPKLIEGMGGVDSARAGMRELRKRVDELQPTIESLDFPSPPDFIDGKDRSFAVIPTRTVLSLRGQRVESVTFQLGVLEKGASDWTYVEGTRLNKDNVRELFPDFPAGYTFPEVSNKNL